MNPLAWLASGWGKIASYAAGAAALAAGVFAAWSAAKSTGKTEQENADFQRTVANTRRAQDVRNEVSGSSDADVARKLRDDWTRH